MGKKSAKKKLDSNGANLGFEAKLWLAADKLRSNMDAAEYKHVVLGLILLKYVADAFEEMHQKLLAGEGEFEGSDPEDADEYRAENVFWVPPEARWKFLQDNAKQPKIGKLVDEAMVAIERDNPRLKGVLPKDYARPALDKHRLGELIDLIGTIGLGDAENRSKDILGRVYGRLLHLSLVTPARFGPRLNSSPASSSRKPETLAGCRAVFFSKAVTIQGGDNDGIGKAGKIRPPTRARGSGKMTKNWEADAARPIATDPGENDQETGHCLFAFRFGPS